MKNLADQYREAKQAAGDALLLFRMGDFWEAFNDDAREVAKLLGLTLTTRINRKTGEELPMTGYPYHVHDAYVAKLVASGRRVAICEPVKL